MCALHARTDFYFSVDLAYENAFPLFGAWTEQEWAPDWKPHFLYPDPPEDEEGAVFEVTRGAHSSIWVLAHFDAASGRITYTSVTSGRIATRIDLTITRSGSEKTDVCVRYEWTALDSSADEQIRALAKEHQHAGEEWKAQIDAYLVRTQDHERIPPAALNLRSKV